MLLIKLRWVQLKKIIYEMASYAVFFSLIILAFQYFLFYVHQDEGGSNKTFLFTLLIISSIHFNRRDIEFVLKNISNARIEMYIEYVILFLFTMSFSMINKTWYLIPIGLLILSVIPFMKFDLKKRRWNKLIAMIPHSLFEWKAGIRRSFLLVLPAYLLAVIFSWFVILPLIALMLISVASMTFYDENESVSVLHEQGISPISFLKFKIISHLSFVGILYLPILIVNTIFNIEYLFINLCFFVAQLFLILFALLTKYKFYVPNYQLVSNSNFTSFIAVLSSLPFFFALPMIFCLKQFPEAVHNLRPHFNHD